MSEGPEWAEHLKRAAALLRALPGHETPPWAVVLAERRIDEGEARYDWEWVWGAERIAASHPERLLTYLTALRSIADERKKPLLDRVGVILAVALVEQPTLAECRAAIDEPDEAPRTRTLWCRSPAPPDFDTALLAFVHDALGCAHESLRRTQDKATSPELDRTPHTASSAERCRVASSRWTSASCTIDVEREESFFPGDVNEPARDHAKVSVSGARRSEAKLAVRVVVDDANMSFDVDAVPDERDRILTKLWRAYGRPPS
ncbi:MAG: hypothetical protein H0T46_07830 [Deltaproteobacteria bacterium]|nr:hypothetical protein [Deltaproteobacteria bacterium]